MLLHTVVRSSLQLRELLLPSHSPTVVTNAHSAASQTQFIVILCSKPWIGQGGVSFVELHKHPRQLLFSGTVVADIGVALKSH